MMLPVFPLSVVLLPRNKLPLHIFEDRYKEMISTVLESGTEFGVVLAAKEGIARVGCTASVEEVLQRYEDGRMDILTLGRRRFLIQSLDQDKPYLQAEVEYFDDDEDAEPPSDLKQKAVKACSDLPAADDVPSLQDPLLSFELARRVDDLEFRQQLLMSRSEADRLRRLIQFAPGYMEQVRRVEHMKEVAPKNGHGKLPAAAKEM
jgi:Lon protease-like protein